MATSGSFTTNSSYGRSLTFKWTQKSQSVSGNWTDINWQLFGSGGSGWVMCGNFKVVISGSIVYNNTSRRKIYNGTVIASGTKRLYHTSTGKCDFSASAQAGIYYVAVNCKGSNSWTLNTIPREAKLTSAPNFSDANSSVTIKYSNPAGNAVDKLEVCIADSPSTGYASAIFGYYSASKTSGSYTFNITDNMRNELYSRCKTSNKLNLRFYIQTTIGGKVYRWYKETEFTVSKKAPSISKLTYWDSNKTVTNITGDSSYIVSNKSILNFGIDTTCYKGAYLKSVKTTFNGYTYNSTGTWAYGATGLQANATVTCTATDSRGNTTTRSKTVVITPYRSPRGEIQAKRELSYYNNTNIKIDGSIYSVHGKNTLKVSYWLKREGWEWGAEKAVSNHSNFNIELDNQYSWTLWVRFKDKFETHDETLIIPRGQPSFFVDRKKQSVGVNCFPDADGALMVNDLDLSKVIYLGSQVLITKHEMYTNGVNYPTVGTPDEILHAFYHDCMLISDLNKKSYKKAWRLSGTISTSENNMAGISVNNVSSGSKSTWSGESFKRILSTRIFTEDMLKEENAHGYDYKGINIKCRQQTSKSLRATFENVTMHYYLLRR